MANILERLALLSTGSGPRNKSLSADRFCVEDLTVALGWVGKPHVVELLLVKYSGHEINTPALINALHVRWERQAAKYRMTGEKFEDLCLLALAEHMDDRRCTHCKGTGEILREMKGSKRPVVCPSCGGNGRYRYSGRTKSSAVGIHKNTWRDRKLDKLYFRMLSSLESWESYGRRRVARAMAD